MKKMTQEEAQAFVKAARERGEAKAKEWHGNVRAKEAEKKRLEQPGQYDKVN